MAEEAPLGGSTAETDAVAREDNRIGLAAIFAAFFWLGVTSFGGNTAAWLYNRIVQRRRWVNDSEFLSDMALGRLMPGSGGAGRAALARRRRRCSGSWRPVVGAAGDRRWARDGLYE